MDDSTGSVPMQRGYWCHQGRSISPLTQNHPGPSWDLPVRVLNAVRGWLWGQKQPWGYVPKLQLRAQPRLGLEQPRGRGTRYTTPAPQALAPCPPVPSSRWSRAGGAVPEHRPPRRRGVCLPLPAAGHPPLPFLGSRSSGTCGPSVPRAALSPASQARCPLLPLGPALGEMRHFAPTQFPAAPCVALPSSLRHRLQSLVSRGLALPLPRGEVQSSLQAPAGLAVPCGSSARCCGRSPEHPSALAALRCVDVPPCSSYQTACWSAQCLYQVNSLSQKGTQ